MAELWAHSCGAEKSPDLSLRFVRPCSFPVIPIIRGVRGNSAAKCLCPSAMLTGSMQLLPAYVNFKDVSSQATSDGPFEVRIAKVSTLRRVDKKPRARHKKPVRDLFEMNSFKIYESIFCYLFVDSGDAFARWKAIPKKKYTELSGILNGIAVGLAGSGLALMLFVASRMLCLNATLDNIKMMSLLYGAGLIWLSSALQTFGSKFRFMAEREERTKSQRKKHFTMLKRELHSLMFKLCTMVMLLVVTLA
ncbi:hypothetical protein KP509_38G042600 [Ceratopteris richardii]|nr:hypothetical protein KP509_38G042600 [Ceratopteris richardii]